MERKDNKTMVQKNQNGSGSPKPRDPERDEQPDATSGFGLEPSKQDPNAFDVVWGD